MLLFLDFGYDVYPALIFSLFLLDHLVIKLFNLISKFYELCYWLSLFFFPWISYFKFYYLHFKKLKMI